VSIHKKKQNGVLVLLDHCAQSDNVSQELNILDKNTLKEVAPAVAQCTAI